MNAHLPINNMQRAKGEIDITLTADGLKRLYQSGSYKLLRPRRDETQGVLVNTAGGLTSGDRFAFQADVEAGAKLTVATQAAERIYQCPQSYAEIANRVKVGKNARFNWLPLETIIYENAKLKRKLTVDLDANAEALIVEALVFGREAMGETVSQMDISDRYQISREGKPIYFDHVKLDHTHLNHPFALNGARAIATILFASSQAEDLLETLRAHFKDAPCKVAASHRNGVLVVRMIALKAFDLRALLHKTVQQILGADLPLTWKI